MAKLFVSIPMMDRDLDDIRADMRAICSIVSEELGEDYELIDSICTKKPDNYILEDPGACGAWYLAKSIGKMAEADLVVFDTNWRFARGCIIEHMICALYNIPYVDMGVSYYDNEDEYVNDYTHDWDLTGSIENQLSEAYEEDALGFEHDDIMDLEGEAESIDEFDDDIDILEPGEYDADTE